MITVIGHDGTPLSPPARAALDAAGCVAGAARHLDALPVPPGAHRLTLGQLEPALDELLGRPEPAAVVASGDPGFFGVVRALRARGVVPRVFPAVSSVATAFARLGLPWDDAVVVSAHGRCPARALAAALAHPKAAILTAPGDANANRFARPLLEAGRAVYVAERLGGADERITRVGAGPDTPAASAVRHCAHPNIVVAVDEDRTAVRDDRGSVGGDDGGGPGWLAGHQGAPERWALPEAEFAHRDSMITKAEVRALALARLGPRPGAVIWDIGAGSGSVAVECARFGAYVIALEHDPRQCARIRENAAAHSVYVDVVEGTVPLSPRVSPQPDAVFVGGGGIEALTGVLAAGDASRPRRVVAALAAVDKVRSVRDLLAGHGYSTGGTALQASRLADLPDESLRLTAANPVFVLWGERS